MNQSLTVDISHAFDNCMHARGGSNHFNMIFENMVTHMAYYGYAC